MNTKMTPVQKINIQENCGELTFQDQQYLVDFEVMNSSELRDKIRVKYELPISENLYYDVLFLSQKNLL